MSLTYKKTVRLMASASIFFYTCMWLTALLVIGTVAQVDIGIHAAQQEYFSSWYFTVGPLPLPGGRLTIGIMFINLFSKLVLNSPLSLRRCGIITAHLGTFCLLIGGIITAYGDIEGSMIIPEGSRSAFFQDHHKIEVAITDTSNPMFDELTAFSRKHFTVGDKFTHKGATFEITEFYLNSTIERRPQDADETYKGVAKRFRLKELKAEVEATMNASGFMIKVTGIDAENDGHYLIFENIAIPASLTLDGKKHLLELRHKHYQLPFSIELLDFKKEVHAGTEMASAYSSTVNVLQGNTSQRIKIEMNKPLRRGGYTFYQSSFIQAEGETTILSVVKNAGRLFPYISSIIICIGLAMHLIISLLYHIGYFDKKKPEVKA